MKHLRVVLAFAALVASPIWTSMSRAQERGSGGPIVTPASLSFSAAQGSTAVRRQSLAVSATRRVQFTASASGASGGRTWLSVAPSGTLTTPQTLTVSVNPSGLGVATYTGTISIRSGERTRTVPVSLTVTGSTAALTLSPTLLSFNATFGGSSPPAQSVTVNASPNTGFTVGSGSATWLTVTPRSGTTPATLSVTAGATALAVGTYKGTITVTGNGLTRTVAVTLIVSAAGGSGGGPFRLIGWNDLGMHCMDGKDYSIFAVLPPYNTIHAHLVDMSGKLVNAPAGFSVTYQAVTDPLSNTINTTSIGKTNFWTYAAALGLGSLAPDVGLKGYAMPGMANTPQAMSFSTSDNTWIAEGIPLLPFSDTAATNYFPMMRLTAKDSTGVVLAATDIVLPTSDEMSCATCHASVTGTAGALPSRGWVNNPDPAKDAKLNILRKHDERFQSSPLFQSAATQVGYNPAGLEITVNNTPVLCYKCHASNALAMNGVAGIKALTASLHGLHATAIYPATGLTLEASPGRNACYTCHPGPKTQCLRGAMGSLKTTAGANAIECQSCHGTLSTLAVTTRQGWLNEPACQACHVGLASATTTTLAYTSAFSSGTTMRTPADATFATNQNMPAAGLSMYRFSSGHGGLQCEACHGSTHAEFSTPVVNDNVQSISLQGHEGMLSECSTCHATVPTTTTGGPHGLHPLGAAWVSAHQDVADSGGTAACQACHGMDYRGTLLSKMKADRTMSGNTFTAGTIIGCYSCHNGPNGGG